MRPLNNVAYELSSHKQSIFRVELVGSSDLLGRCSVERFSRSRGIVCLFGEDMVSIVFYCFLDEVKLGC